MQLVLVYITDLREVEKIDQGHFIDILLLFIEEKKNNFTAKHSDQP
jgi:hypothetical protein